MNKAENEKSEHYNSALLAFSAQTHLCLVSRHSQIQCTHSGSCLPTRPTFLSFVLKKKNSKREISIYYHILCKHRSLQNEGAQQLLTSRFLVLRIISLTWQLCACTESSTQERRTYDSMLAFMWKSD